MARPRRPRRSSVKRAASARARSRACSRSARSIAGARRCSPTSISISSPASNGARRGCAPNIEPEIDTRAFKSLKKLRKNETVVDFIVADTRGLADDLSTEIAEDSDVVFLPTGVSQDDLRPTLGLAGKLARRGAEGRLVVVLSKVGRSETQFARAVATIEDAGFELLSEHWPQRDGFQTDLDAGRAGREARNPHLREIAERMEQALWARTLKAKPRD